MGLYSKASQVYLDDGKANRSGEALTKAANLLAELGEFKESIELYNQALESLVMSGYHNAMTTFRSFNAFLVKHAQWEEAIKNCLAMMTGYRSLKQTDSVYKTCASIVLICLQMDDYVRGDEFQKKFGNEEDGYFNSQESEIGEAFLEAFDKMDQAMLEKCKTNNQLKYLEPSVYKMAMKISLNAGIGSSSTATRAKTPRENKKKAKLLEIDDDEEDHAVDELELGNDESVDDKLVGAEGNAEDFFDPNDLT